MNIRLTPEHINILIKLNVIASKHDCVISCGTNSSFDESVDWDLLKKRVNLPETAQLELSEKTKKEFQETSSYYFELYDKRNKTTHILIYTEASTSFWYDETNLYYDTDISNDTIFWLEKNNSGSSGNNKFISLYSAYHSFYGFDNIEKEKIVVYREGILLNSFANLVCEYLGEEKIK